MRDPARIDQVLAVIREVWLQFPDERLGQLLVNAARVGDPVDLFSVEDSILSRKVEGYPKRVREAQAAERRETR